MKSKDFIISVKNKSGLNRYNKVSYPARYGNYTEIITRDYIYEFDLTGRIKFITGRGNDWPHGDWLKYTKGGDWIFYTAGEYSNIFPYTGEYYTPCLDYASNPFFSYKPFESRLIIDAVSSLHSLFESLRNSAQAETYEKIISKITANRNASAKRLRDIAGEITVLPPDARHSDYDVIPVIAADGCLYNCDFCSVKSGSKVKARSKDNISNQIEDLKDFYGEDIVNYNSIFLGNHDALNANPGEIEFALNESFKLIENSYMKVPCLYVFASVFSFLNASDDFFTMLNNTPFYSYINIGLESFDQATLDLIGKPVSAAYSEEAFLRLIDINKRFPKMEITSNFILGAELPESHAKSICELINKSVTGRYSKGSVYLSPVVGERNNAFIKNMFREIKTSVKLPVYVYLIQRL